MALDDLGSLHEERLLRHQIVVETLQETNSWLKQQNIDKTQHPVQSGMEKNIWEAIGMQVFVALPAHIASEINFRFISVSKALRMRRQKRIRKT